MALLHIKPQAQRDLLQHAGTEWAVESMQWLLNIHFDEYGCWTEDKNIQINLNMLHKAALNTMKQYQARTGSKRPMSKLMFGDRPGFCVNLQTEIG